MILYNMKKWKLKIGWSALEQHCFTVEFECVHPLIAGYVNERLETFLGILSE